LSHKEFCPRSPGYFNGIRHDESAHVLHAVAFNLPCKSWDCPVCSQKKIQQIRARAFNGPIVQQAEIPGYRAKFTQKFLTLTYPGQDFRSRFTPEQALEQMSSSWNKLRTAIKKKYGKFQYFKILEPQKDGYPHFHILLVGKNIAHKSILQYIENLWRDHYLMGFVRLNVITNDVKHGIRYATKYLTKGEQLPEGQRRNIKRYARLFTASRGSLMPVEKKDYQIYGQVVFGQALDDGFHEQEIPALDVSDYIRQRLDPKLKHRVLDDETRALNLLKKMVSNVRQYSRRDI
jgi:hypothetical protein